EKREQKKKKKSLPRGIEPRSPALIDFNDKRKSSPLDQGRMRWPSYCSATWLVDGNSTPPGQHKGVGNNLNTSITLKRTIFYLISLCSQYTTSFTSSSISIYSYFLTH
ncbi:uncharacterized protein N7518_003790, partial [Penicillium psychrosexuale]|uniref:uncharacterized protein n=1 Tax=Penicillium psychrosexuale TaxID=1002107 RepID=UPI0025452880